MLMNGNKLRIHVNMALKLNMDNILLRITSADSAPGRNRDGG